MSRPTQRCMADSLSKENWVVYGRANTANGAAFSAKRTQSGKRAKAMSPVLPATVHQAL